MIPGAEGAAPSVLPVYEKGRYIRRCSICGQAGVTAQSHQPDGTHRRRPHVRRRPGCLHCGSRDHITKTHFGPGDRKRTIIRLTPRIRKRRGVPPDPLGLARSSWLIQSLARVP